MGVKTMEKKSNPTGTTLQAGQRRVKRLMVAFLALSIILLAASPGPYRTKDRFIVVLDAGHGGKDPGNLGTGRYKRTEKDVSLDVTLAVGGYIEENYPDVQVVYTRKGDTFPTLKDRVDAANASAADLFISIHCNANDNKAAYGSETYVMGLHKSEESLKNAMRENASIFLEENHEEDYAGFDPKNPDTYIALSLRENVFLDQSLNLAKHVQDQFRGRVGRKDRGVKQAGYYVISFTNMPSVLVELGFLTNSEEEDFLHSDQGKVYMSSAIYRAFKDYYEKITHGKSIAPKGETAELSIPVPDKPQANPTPKPVETAYTGEIVWREVPAGIRYQVQILSSVKPVDKKSPDFKGLDKVEEYFSNGAYRYLAGRTASFKEARSMQDALRKMGFRDAFVVAFEKDKRVDLSVALQKTE
jgi:N-acetylmuramoyl-L-alanine amidase